MWVGIYPDMPGLCYMLWNVGINPDLHVGMNSDLHVGINPDLHVGMNSDLHVGINPDLQGMNSDMSG
jgi:hypothetical protein